MTLGEGVKRIVGFSGANLDRVVAEIRAAAAAPHTGDGVTRSFEIDGFKGSITAYGGPGQDYVEIRRL